MKPEHRQALANATAHAFVTAQYVRDGKLPTEALEDVVAILIAATSLAEAETAGKRTAHKCSVRAQALATIERTGTALRDRIREANAAAREAREAKGEA